MDHDGAEVRRLGPGDVLGELALLGDGRRHADAVAVHDVRVGSMFGTHFREMQTSMPSVEAGLERLADDRLARPSASDQPASATSSSAMSNFSIFMNASVTR